MLLSQIARGVLENYPNGIKIWQLQEEAKYFGIEANSLLKEICTICQEEEEF